MSHDSPVSNAALKAAATRLAQGVGLSVDQLLEMDADGLVARLSTTTGLSLDEIRTRLVRFNENEAEGVNAESILRELRLLNPSGDIAGHILQDVDLSPEIGMVGSDVAFESAESLGGDIGTDLPDDSSIGLPGDIGTDPPDDDSFGGA